MDQNLQQTPKANRIHIGFFGRCNAGKSSLVNAVTGQQMSITSPVAGTTTDPVEKAMELLPLGPVVIVDTPGLNDTGELGALRMQRTYQTLERIDIAVLVLDSTVGQTEQDILLEKQCEEKKVPCLLAWNKTDLWDHTTSMPERALPVCAKTGDGIYAFKEQLAAVYKTQTTEHPEPTIFNGMLSTDDIVILVTPIDQSAPKGRMILPQVQSIREILDTHATCFVTQPEELEHTMLALRDPPKLVVTDSQAFEIVNKIVPKEVPLTSFSILFAHRKGVLEPSIRAVKCLDTLPEGASILIAEGCTHHRQCEDIGTVKIPKWIQQYTGKTFQYNFTSGKTFPEDLTPYALIIHCGGCMLSQKEMAARAEHAKAAGIPFTNYGILIAYMHGIIQRSLNCPIFQDIQIQI